MIRHGAPMRVVPSRRGLAFVFTVCGLAGFAAGILADAIHRWAAS